MEIFWYAPVFRSSLLLSGAIMQSQSQPTPESNARWFRVAAAGSFAAFGVWLAVQQLISASRAPESRVSGQGRGPTPEFWLNSHAAGREQAQATGKPIFLVIRCEP